MSELPRHGVTVRAHVEQHLERALADLTAARLAVVLNPGYRFKPAEREKYRKLLAGVVFDCESVRLWLDAGCPER